MSDNTDETLGEEPQTWLHQFQLLTKESLTELESVVKAGLEPAENEALILAAVELIKLATVHDPEALAKVTELIHPTAQENTDHSQSF